MELDNTSLEEESDLNQTIIFRFDLLIFGGVILQVPPPLTSLIFAFKTGLLVLHVVCLFDGDLSRGRAETHHARSRVSWLRFRRGFFFWEASLLNKMPDLSEETLRKGGCVFLGQSFYLRINVVQLQNWGVR